LTRANIDALRSRIIVETTAIEVHGKVRLGQEPKTRRSKRTVPLARSVMRRLEQHLADHVESEPDALALMARRGGPLFRSTFAREAWRPAVKRAGLDGFTFHDLRHNFVAILVAASSGAGESQILRGRHKNA
jgi:integrase